ncbi:MAG: NADH-quinone oxidoreductase subunit J family protein [Acidiferrobacter sp.]
MTALLDLLIGVVVLGAVVALVMVRDPLHGAINLGIGMLALAILFLQLGAPFIAAMAVMLYVGAILVLFLFAIMLLRPPVAPVTTSRWRAGRVWPSVMLGGLATAIGVLFFPLPRLTTIPTVVGPTAVGRALFGPYMWLVEAVALLLFAVIGAALAIHGRADDDA